MPRQRKPRKILLAEGIYWFWAPVGTSRQPPMSRTQAPRRRRRRSAADILADIDEALDEHIIQGSSSGYGKRWPYQGSF